MTVEVVHEIANSREALGPPNRAILLIFEILPDCKHVLARSTQITSQNGLISVWQKVRELINLLHEVCGIMPDIQDFVSRGWCVIVLGLRPMNHSRSTLHGGSTFERRRTSF